MRRALIAAAIALTAAAASTPASAAPTFTLDPSFGSGGKDIFPVAPGSNNTQLYDSAVQADGKIVSVGVAYQDGAFSDGDGFIARRNENGTPDTGFGTNGIATVPINLVADGSDSLNAVAIGPAGTIFAAGDAQASSGRDIVVVSYDASGNPSAGFGGGDGIFSFSTGSFDSGHAIGLLADATIAVAGSQNLLLEGDAVLARVKADGTGLVSAFGTAGVRQTSLGGTRFDSWEDLQVHDGVITLGGGSDQNSAAGDAMFGRFNATDGAPVPGFNGGAFAVPADGVDRLNGIDVRDDGGVAAAGERGVGGSSIPTALMRNPNGDADTGFDGDGRLEIEFSDQINFGTLQDVTLVESAAPGNSAGAFATEQNVEIGEGVDVAAFFGGLAFRDSSAGSADAAVAAAKQDGTVVARSTQDIGGANDLVQDYEVLPLLEPNQLRVVGSGFSFDGSKEVASIARFLLFADVTPGSPTAPPAEGGTPPAGGVSEPPARGGTDLEIRRMDTGRIGFKPGTRIPDLSQFTSEPAQAVGNSFYVAVGFENRGRERAVNAVIEITLPDGAALDGAKIVESAVNYGGIVDGVETVRVRCVSTGPRTVRCEIGGVPTGPPGSGGAGRLFIPVVFASPVAAGAITGRIFDAGTANTGPIPDTNPLDNTTFATVDVTGNPDTTATVVRDGAAGAATGASRPVPGGTAQLFRPSAAQAEPSIERLTQLARVEVAVLKKQSNKRRCLWLANTRLKFKARPARAGMCDRGRWLKANGTRRWRFKLARNWPPGTYTLYSRAVNRAGVRETQFSKRDKNVVTFTIRR